MSNVSYYGGLRLYRMGTPQQLETCIALAGDSTPLGIGDAVKISAGGATNIASGPIYQAVTRCAAGDSVYGVIEGVDPIIEGSGAINLGICYRAASTAQYVKVRRAYVEDEYTITDDGSAALTKANIGNNANLVVANCDTYSGLSKMQIDATTVSSGNATRQLKLIGYMQVATNDATSTGATWIVSLNNVYASGGTGTVGV